MFVPTRIVAVAAVALLAPAVSALAQDGIHVNQEPSSITVLWGKEPLLRYQTAPNPGKPYVHSLFSPAGVNVLRDSPADHKHHHGLMFAVAVDGVDFWSETPQCGKQMDCGARPEARGGRTPVKKLDDLTSGVVVQELEWTAPDGKVLLNERRTVQAGRLPEGPATLVVWRAKLEAPKGKASVTLSGSPYFGLGMRFVASMDQGGRFFNADGKTGVAGTNDARSAWCAYAANADGKPVTVAMFDLPGNPRHPARWFTMDQGFAYLAATLNLNKEPLVIESVKPMELGYAVAVWDGTVDATAVGKLYQQVLGGAKAAE
ncbi:MAG: PmoA family protein [Thermoguttaceae bacterium]|jgi:LacI family transcriptional regulator|nr:PmoA family protein [Thermoguttaceae bacterium]